MNSFPVDTLLTIVTIFSIIYAHKSFFYAVCKSEFLCTMLCDPTTFSATFSYLGTLFLLYKNPALTLVPSQQVDEVLHRHMNQASFTTDCINILGTADLIHCPGQINPTTFIQTRNLMARIGLAYGNVPAACEIFIQVGDRA